MESLLGSILDPSATSTDLAAATAAGSNNSGGTRTALPDGTARNAGMGVVGGMKRESIGSAFEFVGAVL